MFSLQDHSFRDVPVCSEFVSIDRRNHVWINDSNLVVVVDDELSAAHKSSGDAASDCLGGYGHRNSHLVN